MDAARERQYTRLTEVTDKIGISDAAMDRPLDICMCFG